MSRAVPPVRDNVRMADPDLLAPAPPVERLLTPSKITAWLDCPHYLSLKHAVEAGTRARRSGSTSSFAQLLMDKGLAHEAAVLEAYRAHGLHVVEVDDRDNANRESFAAWAERCASFLSSDADVLFQMPFVHDGIRGIADFLERVVEADGTVRWEPVDAKLARKAAKPGHVLQLCFYAEAIEARTGVTPLDLKVSLGSGRTDVLSFDEVRPYWTRLRAQVRAAIDAGPDDTPTRPEPCDHCDFCEFAPDCEQTWRDADSLIYVAGIRRAERAALETDAVGTLALLAERTAEVADLRTERLTRLRTQAALQVKAREAGEPAKPPFLLIEADDDEPVWGHGFEHLPAPDPGDIFLDFEGHPFWRADRGLFFLFGYVAADETGQWRYQQLWAHDEASERVAVEQLIADIEARRAGHPGMHVYHYNHTERSALQALSDEYAVAEAALGRLIDAGVFVDLLLVARNAVQVGVEGYGLKHLERLTDYERRHDIDKGAGAVVAYEAWMADGDPDHLVAIARYNDDDVRATRALRDWLVDHRPAELDWRPDAPEGEQSELARDVDELLEGLAAFEPGTPQRDTADLLGYWRREWRVYAADVMRRLVAEADKQATDVGTIGGLHDPVEVSALTPTGRARKWPSLRLSFPPQELAGQLVEGDLEKVIYLTDAGQLAFAVVDELDAAAGTLALKWDQRCQEHGTVPAAVVPDEWFSPRAKFDAIVNLGRQLLDPATAGAPNPATLALLVADEPRFVDGGGPADGRFTDDPAQLAQWVCQLDAGVLAVQGPPGTGKTYRGAHIAKALVRQGWRVGVMSMSHHAIGNMLEGMAKTFAEAPSVDLRAMRKVSDKERADQRPIPGVTNTESNPDLAGAGVDVVAGTAWAFASPAMINEPVDVLLVDEAGQLALVDALAGSVSARNVVLLGDPLQLAQVSQATHPGISGLSALGHLLRGEDTISDDRGVFVKETRRMHPDVCRFISDRIYGGRLGSFADCARQATTVGTGLRWLRVEHAGCSTDSIEEAEAVAARIQALLGETWTDQQGVVRPVTVDDVMVVAPYNDQVRLLRRHLASDPSTAGVQVGTVDKFQGREAPIVFFTMTSSSTDDMPRGPEFLFSRNRLNVAVSRAQCLAYLVCTETLLDSRARTVDDMHLIANLCAFVEYSGV